ncbi:MAG TPA: hypothetical protein V6D00_01935 [Pantanalinema sp.]
MSKHPSRPHLLWQALCALVVGSFVVMVALQGWGLHPFTTGNALALHLGQYRPALLKPPFNVGVLLAFFASLGLAVAVIARYALRPETEAGEAIAPETLADVVKS